MTGPHDDAQDLAWVRAVQRDDDRHAFAALLRCHQGGIRALLRRLCGGNAALADELAQESFLSAYQAIGGFRAESRFRTWLYRVAYNVFLQHARRGETRLARQSQTTDDADANAIASTALPIATAVAMGLDLQRALDALSAPERVAIVHCHLAELSHAEAAEVLGWPLGTVKTHVARGKAKLRLSLAAWAAPPGREKAA